MHIEDRKKDADAPGSAGEGGNVEILHDLDVPDHPVGGTDQKPRIGGDLAAGIAEKEGHREEEQHADAGAYPCRYMPVDAVEPPGQTAQHESQRQSASPFPESVMSQCHRSPILRKNSHVRLIEKAVL